MARLGDRETAPVIAAQSPNGSSDTKITASPVLSEKAVFDFRSGGRR
jgi:hypothetical protein